MNGRMLPAAVRTSWRPTRVGIPCLCSFILMAQQPLCVPGTTPAYVHHYLLGEIFHCSKSQALIFHHFQFLWKVSGSKLHRCPHILCAIKMKHRRAHHCLRDKQRRDGAKQPSSAWAARRPGLSHLMGTAFEVGVTPHQTGRGPRLTLSLVLHS